MRATFKVKFGSMLGLFGYTSMSQDYTVWLKYATAILIGYANLGYSNELTG